jgi:hypothetical protein
MDGFSRLAYVETKLFLRETGAAIGVFGSRPTCCISTPSWASTTAPPRWRRASSGACCPARELPGRILRIAGKAVRKECR